MSIKEKVKRNLIVLYLWNEYRRIKGNVELKKIDDLEFIVSEYKRRTGNSLQLAFPERFTEKLQWLKLFYRDEKIEECSDKYMARLYVEKQGYSELLNELIGVYDNVNDIDLDSLPDKFVLKASHGSGWNIVCTDKSRLNWRMYKHIIRSWMRQNLYVYGREWNYKNLTPKIIIEKYIDSGDGQLTDYKFFCFNGKPAFVQVDRDRFHGHKQSYYDMEWKKLSFTTGHEAISELRPTEFERMKQLAEELSKPFPHVRVDFYNVDKQIYFGEFTYFDGSGFYRYEPDEWDFHWGTLLQLPEVNYNDKTYQNIMLSGENNSERC